MLVTLYWSAVAVLLYTYLIFPLLVYVRSLLWRVPLKTDDITPTVTVIIAAHNEARHIGAKLKNMLSLDYPTDRLDVIVVSDGSTDETESIVRDYAAKHADPPGTNLQSVPDPVEIPASLAATAGRVHLLALPRSGKARALNAAAGRARGEVLVFSDANSMFDAGAVRALVRPFADPGVGGVAGDQRYLTWRHTSAADSGERAYWSLDRMLKRWQSRSGNVISATGAIYAVRRSLFQTVPVGVTDDFVTSTRVIAQGFRLVFAPEAVAREPVAASGGVEFGRKLRVITRGLRSVLVMRELLNPFRHGFYAVQLFSHKVLRRLMGFPLLLLLVTNLAICRGGLFYQATLLAQLGFCGCALLAILPAGARVGRLKIATIPFYFCLVNTAAMMATCNVLLGKRVVLWEPQRV